MPHVIPIRDLKNTSEISKKCHECDEPIIVTKNGYGDMVIMSIEQYEENLYLANIYRKISEAESDIKEGRTLDAKESLEKLKEKYDL